VIELSYTKKKEMIAMLLREVRGAVSGILTNHVQNQRCPSAANTDHRFYHLKLCEFRHRYDRRPDAVPPLELNAYIGNGQAVEILTGLFGGITILPPYMKANAGVV
jgi:hypothetical protein